ncbi:unnamed protein product [Symbiodinium sp. CCMP2592]|nr:unnamed protein product [Symbiodinium sp. CCMP2592]
MSTSRQAHGELISTGTKKQHGMKKYPKTDILPADSECPEGPSSQACGASQAETVGVGRDDYVLRTPMYAVLGYGSEIRKDLLLVENVPEYNVECVRQALGPTYKAANLADYEELYPHKMYPDLQQTASKMRGGSGTKVKIQAGPWSGEVLTALQTFDPERDEHPCEYVATKLATLNYDALHTWLQQMSDGAVMHPSSVNMPADKTSTVFQTPILSFGYKKPTDGWPILGDWVGHATSIYTNGYESWRETVELKVVSDASLGQPMSWGCVLPAKGFGRISVLLFGIIYSYSEMHGKPHWSDDVEKEFKQCSVLWIRTAIAIPTVFIKAAEHEYNWRRLQLNIQATEKQRRNMLQQCLIFHARAEDILADNWQQCVATAGAAKKDSKEAYHTAFLAAISEYNNYGAAKTSSKYQIDSGTANAMFGLKVEIVTLLGTVHEHMVKAVDASGNSLFSKEVLEDVNRRILEGDYHEEAGTHLEAICQAFKPNHMAMWADNLPSLRSDSAMGDAENALNQMSAETQRLTWEQDTLKLASDVAMIGKMYSSFQKSERTRNSLGATLVENTMDRWCKHVTGTEDLNTIATQIKNILSRRPLASMAVVMAPRIEEKLEAKDLTSEMIIVRMENPPSSKAVPMNLPGWLVYDDAGVDDNEFASCRLRMDRGTREPIPWTPQRLYVVPNERRMAAQLLAGGEFPVSVMSACLTGANQALLPAVKASRLVRVINITPYDGHFEKAMLRYHLGEDERPRISCLSVGQDPAIMQYSQSVLALSLMEDWKNDHKMLHSEPGYKKYEKNPVEPTTDFDLRDFPLKMVTCTLDNSKRSLEKLRLALPTEIRTKYAADPLRSQEWLELVAAFDSQFGTNTPAATEASAAPAAAGTSKPGWSSEPTTLDALCSTYDIEFKIASRTPGASLFIVKATDRGGNLSEVEEGQDMKMFLVATAAASPTTARPSPLPMQSEDRTDPMQREKRSELAQSLAVAMKQTKEKLKKDGGDSGDSKAKATGLSAAQSWAKAKNEGKNDAKKKGPKSKKAKKAKAESEEHHIEGEGEEEEDLDEVDALGEGLLDSDEDINKDEKKEAKKKAKAKETAKDEKDTEETDDKKPAPKTKAKAKAKGQAGAKTKAKAKAKGKAKEK